MAHYLPVGRSIIPGEGTLGKFAVTDDAARSRFIVIMWSEYGFVFTCPYLIVLLGRYLDTFEDLCVEVDGTHKVMWDKWVLLSLGLLPSCFYMRANSCCMCACIKVCMLNTCESNNAYYIYMRLHVHAASLYMGQTMHAILQSTYVQRAGSHTTYYSERKKPAHHYTPWLYAVTTGECKGFHSCFNQCL